MAISKDEAIIRNRAANKKWRAKNKDKLAAAKKIWAANNRGHIQEYDRLYAKTPERREYHRKFKELERASNPALVRARQRDFYRARRDRDPEGASWAYFRMAIRKYGLTPEAYDDLFRSQDFKCAVCRTSEAAGKRFWQIDHCHKTLKVRGILCRNCNLMLGMALDSPNTLVNAAAYIERNAVTSRP